MTAKFNSGLLRVLTWHLEFKTLSIFSIYIVYLILIFNSGVLKNCRHYRLVPAHSHFALLHPQGHYFLGQLITQPPSWKVHFGKREINGCEKDFFFFVCSNKKSCREEKRRCSLVDLRLTSGDVSCLIGFVCFVFSIRKPIEYVITYPGP